MAPIATLTVRLSAQIAEFQSEFREATKSAEKFQGEFQGIATKASALGNIIAQGVIGAVSALKSMAAAVLENAGKITDLSNKTGLAIRTIQEFQHVADQTGTTVDAFTNAAFKLGANLAGNDKSVAHAVERLGLSFSQLKALSPDEQFNRIAKALSEMENPQERNRIALTLFGREAKSILPAIAEGYDKLRESAIIAGDEQVKALDRAADAWDRFKRGTTSRATEIAGSIILVGESASSSFKSFEAFTTELDKGGFGAAIAITAAKMKEAADDAERMARAVRNAPRIGDISFGQPGTGSQRPNQFGVGINVEAELKRLEEAHKKAQRAAEAHAQAVKALADRLSGAELTGEVRLLTQAFASLSVAQRNTPAVMQRTADAAFELFEAGAQLSPELFKVVTESGRLSDLMPSVKSGLDMAALGFQQITGGVQDTVDQLIEFNKIMDSIRATPGISGEVPGFQFRLEIPEPPPPTFWQKFLEIPGETLAQSARRNADHIIGSLGDAIATGDWSDFTNSLKESVANFAGAAIAAGVNAIPGLGGLGTLLQPLFTGLSAAFINLFDRNRGRDLVESFAQSFGGFDALQKRLERLGAEGDRLWRQLTQGVGRNNPEQARAAIAAVSAALEQQTQILKENQAFVTGLVQAHLGAGAVIPAALQASIDKAVELGVVTRENAAAMLGLAEVIKPSFAEIQKAADILGVNVEAIGEGILAIRFSEQAEEIAAAFLTVERAGADMTEVFKQSVGKVQPLVTEALRFGRELPESMRPFLQSMAELGLLTDEQGNKLTDLSRLNFAAPLTEKINDLIVKIGELIESITGGLGGALDDISRRRVTIPIGYRVEPTPDLDLPGTRTGTVVPVSSLPSAEPGSSTVIIDIDGRQVAEATVPWIPNVVERYGLAGV
jgi:uncharacterized protein YoxC